MSDSRAVLAEVAARGWASFRVDEVGTSPERAEGALLEAVRGWGIPSRRDGGSDVWPIRPRLLDQSATFSVRNGAAGLHTDAQYHQKPEDLVVICCVRPADSGGESTLLGLSDVWEAIRTQRDSGDLVRWLRAPVWGFEVPLEFGGGDGAARVPVLGESTIRWRRDNLRAERDVPAEQIADAFAAACESSPRKVVLPLGPGDAIVMDNRRVLHGRLGFEDPQRHLLRVRLWRWGEA